MSRLRPRRARRPPTRVGSSDRARGRGDKRCVTPTDRRRVDTRILRPFGQKHCTSVTVRSCARRRLRRRDRTKSDQLATMTRPYEKRPAGGDLQLSLEHRSWRSAQKSATESWRTTKLRTRAKAQQEALEGIQTVMKQYTSSSTNNITSNILREIVDDIAGHLATLKVKLDDAETKYKNNLDFLRALKTDNNENVETFQDKRNRLQEFAKRRKTSSSSS